MWLRGRCVGGPGFVNGVFTGVTGVVGVSWVGFAWWRGRTRRTVDVGGCSEHWEEGREREPLLACPERRGSVQYGSMGNPI